jgi:CBS domain-containing protein
MPELPTARDVMTRDLVSVPPDLSVKDAARLMVDRGVGALPVVEGDALVGLVTEGDLIMQDVRVRFPTTIHLLDAFIFYPPSQERMENEIRKAVAATVREVMSPDPVTVEASASIEDVATAMVDRDVSRVPVLEDGKLVGIVSKSDIVRSIASQG